MAKEDEEKTLFTTLMGMYCYVRMPFELKNAGPTFQRTMHITLPDLWSRIVETYVNDIMVKTRQQGTSCGIYRKPSIAYAPPDSSRTPKMCFWGYQQGSSWASWCQDEVSK